VYIRYKKKTYEIEDPVPMEGYARVKVEKYIVFPSIKSANEQVFRFSHSKRKLLYHALREGLIMTFNKTKVSFFQRKVIGTRALVLVVGTELSSNGKETRRVAAVGPAECPQSDIQLFPEECVAEMTSDRSIEGLFALLSQYFKAKPEAAEQLFYHDPYSGLELPFSLSDVLQSEVQGSQGQHACEVLEAPRGGGDGRKTAPTVGKDGKFDLFLMGAGAYTFMSILPYLKKNVCRHTLVDKHPALACVVAEKYGFLHKDTSGIRALERASDVEKPIVVIATYHSTHVPLAEAAFKANPKAKIFIEKPPVTDREQIKTLLRMREQGAHIEIGYNRRCIHDVRRAKELLATKKGPTTVTCIVKEKVIPMSHWYYWPTQGTRIVGNATHWIDLGMHLVDAMPIQINSMSSSTRFPADDAAISVHFDDGSQVNIIATDRGNGLRGIQEYIDVRKDELTIEMNDFLQFRVMEGGGSSTTRHIIRDKGHKRMYVEFLERCRGGHEAVYPTQDLEYISRLYLDIKDALMEKKRSVDLDYSRPL
jgi:predicted dehydrogenase